MALPTGGIQGGAPRGGVVVGMIDLVALLLGEYVHEPVGFTIILPVATGATEKIPPTGIR